MGVPGLTTYISENSKLYLEPYELCDCYLVVDGNNIASYLYRWLSESHSAFGGDYDEYCRTVSDFFKMLMTCNVTPIVLFDGGCEKRKLHTKLERAKGRLPIMRLFAKGFTTTKFYPLLTKQAFCDVMEDLGIVCLQCDFEADGEIAAIARALNCPVLSYDSDFFIFDVLYIPFSSVYTSPVKFDDSNKYYVRCSIYNVTNFLSQFEGLDKSLLPLIATLLGNDYIKSDIFQKFFSNLRLPKNKNLSNNQRKIHGVLHWMKNESFESALQQITGHLKSRHAGNAIQAIKTGVKGYTDVTASEIVVDALGSKIGNVLLSKKPSSLSLPPEICKHYHNCRINNFIIDMITLRTYFSAQQVEFVYGRSTHTSSLQLITQIYTLLSPYIKGTSRSLKMYMILKNQYCAVRLINFHDYLKNVNLSDLLKQSEKVRLRWFLTILGVDDNDMEIVPKSNWSIFILSFIYWIRQLNQEISLAHIHALILTAIANQVIQKCFGYYRSRAKFLKSKGKLLAQLKDNPIKAGEGKDFSEMLHNVTLYEKLLVHNALMPLRVSTEKGTGKAYCISTIHLFGSFQSCLYHIMQVNALLNYPLPHLKVGDFYSGTLLFNLYLNIKGKPSVEKFGCSLFKDAPNLRTIYTYLSESLCEYSVKTDAVMDLPNKKHRKRKRLKKAPEICEEEILLQNADDVDSETDEYMDENNPYAILQRGTNC